MKKLRLSPFVQKVKGIKNWVLVDLLKGRIFQIIPEGSVEQFKEQLKDKKLAYETEGVIPFKFEVSLKKYSEKLRIRQLQIRLTGFCQDDCKNCGEICSCFKGDGKISDQVLENIIDQFKTIPIEQVLITGGNPLSEWSAIEKITKEISASKFTILFRGHVDDDYINHLTELKIDLISTLNVELSVTREKMNTDSFSFFYSQAFNSCWGNKVAIDVDGSIKPCLWFNMSLGNILDNEIRDMIIFCKFKEYWELTKDKIESCDVCEYRYNCFDCRVSAIKEKDYLYAKFPCCRYDPRTGIWE